jgi:hypothetical protein
MGLFTSCDEQNDARALYIESQCFETCTMHPQQMKRKGLNYTVNILIAMEDDIKVTKKLQISHDGYNFVTYDDGRSVF